MLQQEASERVTAQAAGGVLQPTATASPQKGSPGGALVTYGQCSERDLEETSRKARGPLEMDTFKREERGSSALTLETPWQRSC